MDQQKIGKFIAQCRKDKKITQQELANKLGITDRAVSHWENGRSIPDVSLYKDLCNELGISIEELINGEKDNSDNAKEKAIITVVREKNTMKTNYKRIILAIIVLFIGLTTAFIVGNKINLVNDSDNLYDEVIDYLREKELRDNPESKEKDFNVFYSYHGFGIEKKNEYKYVYMWVCDQSYYIEKEENGSGLAISSGSSVALKAIFKNNKIQKIIYPEDGNEYVKSIKKMFPRVIRNQVLNFESKDKNNINKMFNEIENKKNAYYNYLNLDMSKITKKDLLYDNLLFTIEYRDNECNIHVLLDVFGNNKYRLMTGYYTCKPGVMCTSDLRYTNPIEGTYNYDVIEIIRHSKDANNLQFNNDMKPYYEIYSGKGYPFITDENNKYLKEFLEQIKVNLKECATPVYK